MRKVLSVFLAISIVFVLCFNCTSFSLAEGTSNIREEPIGEFNYSVLQGLKGYDYDKFDKCWSYYAAYDEVFNDADVIIGIKLFGEDGGNNLEEADLYTKIIDKKGQPLKTVISMDYLIDDVLYSYKKMPGETGTMAGSVILYDTGYELVKAFADAKSVSVKLSFSEGGYINIDLNQYQFSQTLQELCKNVVNHNIWDYYIPNPMLAIVENTMNLTIS